METDNQTQLKEVESDKIFGFIPKDMKWYQKIPIIIFCGFLMLLVKSMTTNARCHSQQKARFKKKLKYFNPTVREGWFGKEITWVGRDKPLSDEEVKKLM